ncbi:MAG TPA: VOC family protein, partial [Thermoplasmata archaeon]|nr:VOC family protein [Thermoplasmata archaeon]
MGEKKLGPHLLYCGIRVRYLDRSMKFYAALGLRPSMKGEMKHGGKWVWMRDPRTKQIVELNWYPGTSEYYEGWRSGVEMDHLGWSIRDIGTLLTRFRALGAKVKADFVQGNVRLTFVEDRDGIWHEFLSWTERGQ